MGNDPRLTVHQTDTVQLDSTYWLSDGETILDWLSIRQMLYN